MILNYKTHTRWLHKFAKASLFLQKGQTTVEILSKMTGNISRGTKNKNVSVISY